MAELVAETKALTIHMKCEICGKGLMKRFGDTVLTAYPPQYPHKCNHCGHIENYSVEYPKLRLVPIEILREPTEDEVGGYQE